MRHFILQMNWGHMETRLGGESITSLVWCVGIIIATLLLKRPITLLLARIIAGVTNRFTDKQNGAKFRELIHQPLEQLIQTVLFYVAVNQLGILLNHFVFKSHEGKQAGFSIRISDVTDHIFLFLVILFSTSLLSRVLDFIYYVQTDKAIEEDNRERQQLLPLIKEIAKLLLWTIGVFWTLGSVFHVNIPALITGLGIGGVAIALAAKESVENFFAAFTILTDKPFRASDSIKLGSIEGVVERIGFRSTRLRSGDGSTFIIPNKKLVNENLENLTYRTATRIKVSIPIKYGISHIDLQQMIAELKQEIPKQNHVKKPVDIALDNFGENVFQLLLTYNIDFPLQQGISATNIKQNVAMVAYEIINKYMSTAIGTASATKEDISMADEDNAGEDLT